MAVTRLEILNKGKKQDWKMNFYRLFLAQGILLSLLVTALTGGPVYSSPTAVSSLPNVPPGLKSTFMVGLASQPDNLSWMTGSGAAWDARYQYMVGGVNNPPDNNWSTWNSPAGQFANNYIDASTSSGYLPVFTYYQIYQSGPGVGADEAEKDYNNLNNTQTMRAYFADFKLLMDRIKLSGKTVLVHIEPDLWGFMQKRATNPQNISAAVASSGYADVASYPNTVAGFAKALVGLRNKYAPNALLAYHISPWSSTYGDLASNTTANFNVSGAAQETANFYSLAGADFDLLFYDIADRDAGYYAVEQNQPNRWWDLTNATYPNFNRFNQFVAAITAATNKRGVLWQIPLGNTLYRSMNNTDQHWQDNRVQYYLGADDNQNIQGLADAGIIGLLFGRGNDETTSYNDAAQDGITNPAAINGNTLTASYSDDDGGNMRLRGKAYYTRGRLSLPNPAQNPTFASNPANGATISLTASSGNPASSNINVSNTGATGSTLMVSAPSLSGSGASSFSVSPPGNFSLAVGAAAKTVTVTCNPQAAGILTATLTYGTNDPVRPNISYNLSCSVQVAHFSSTPYAPGASIELTGQQNQTISTTINVSNTGGTGTVLNVGAGQLSQQTAGIFTISPAQAFSVNAGATAQIVTVNCKPKGTGVQYTGTLTYSTNDPSQPSVVYNLTCNSPFSITVNNPEDNGSGDQSGSLSQALETYATNQIINFSVPEIKMTGTALPVANNGKVIIDGGSCVNGVPGLTIDGNNRAMDGLTLGAGVQLRNIMIKNFKGKLIVSNALQGGGNNKFDKCVVLRK